ncbi:hypothetical protein [Bradyrhizobium sp. USDA 241]|uniref:hypothetical protein n=1 Tax=Bradyrhizobium sp. USDA 241 TaxID=3377725 RepID=UPI003C70D1B5
MDGNHPIFHAPEVECIGKGKAAVPYEFGVKASTRRRRQITASDGAAWMSLEVVVAHEHLIATTARIAQLQNPCMDIARILFPAGCARR